MYASQVCHSYCCKGRIVETSRFQRHLQIATTVLHFSNAQLKKHQNRQNQIKSTRALTARVPSLTVFVVDFEQVLSFRSTNPDFLNYS